MLTENDILEVLSSYLIAKGYKEIKRSNTKQTGVDLIAENADEILYIEAKGETSSKSETSRFGLEFSGGQIKSHVSRAILAAFEIISEKPAGSRTKAAIALPNNKGHQKLINKILPALTQSGIRVFLVGFDSVVEL